MIVLEELTKGTMKAYNCCEKRAIQIIADRANTGRIDMLKTQIKEAEQIERINAARNANEPAH